MITAWAVGAYIARMDEQERLRESLLKSTWREILATTPDNVRNFPAAARAIDARSAPAAG